MFNPTLYPIQQNSGVTLIGDRVKLKSLLFLERSPTQSAEYIFYFPANFGSDGQALFRSGTGTTFRGIAIADIANLQAELDTIDTTLGTLGTAAFQPTTAFAASTHIHGEATTSVSGFLSNIDKTKIDGLGTASTKNTGTTNNTVPLIGAGDKLVSGIIPDINGTISDSFTLNSDAANSGSDRSIILSRSASQSASYTLVYPTTLGTANQSLIISYISGSSAILGWGSSGSSSNVTALSGSSVSIDLSLGTFFTITLSANTSISSITNALGNGVEFTIKVNQNTTGGFTFSPPAGVAITGSIDTAASSQSLIKFFTFNGGTNWEAVVIKPHPSVVSQSSLWTPSEINTSRWLDASASNTIFFGSGISQWSDKKGGGSFTQSTASSQPALINNAVNGKSVVRFDGGDLLTSSYSLTSVKTIAMIVKQSSLVNSFIGCVGGQLITFKNDGLVCLRKSYDGSIAIDSTVSSLQYNIIIIQIEANNAILRVNGTQIGTDTSYNSFTGNVEIGVGGDSLVSGLNGDIYQLILAETTFNSSILEKLEGYFAYSAALQNLLPSNHPYKTSAPTI